LIKSTHKFKTVKKDRWFYDQFEYCLGFRLDEVSCLRVLDHAHIDDMIDRRKEWREIAQQRWVNGRQKHGIIMSRRWKEITETTKDNLHLLADQLLTATTDFKLVVSMNQGYVYTNDLNLIQRLDSMPVLSYKTYTQANIHRPKNTIQLRNPKYSFRSYFKVYKLSRQQKDQLNDFLINQQLQIRTSPSLNKWFNSSLLRTQDYFFIDHASESWVTMLSLVQPGIIRKTMQIVPTK
jgi:hypothetical protein